MPLLKYIFSFFTAFIISLGLTPVIIYLCRSTGIVEKPREDRWHKNAVAKFGGISIFLGFIIPSLIFADFNKNFWGLLLGTTLIFSTGLLDDLIEIKPQFKLLSQMISGLIMVFFGITFGLFDSPYISMITIPISVFWILSICNAFNLLDNIDGLAAGIAVITSLTIGVSSIITENYEAALFPFILAGTALGFLVFNFNPAKIFMGDCGSMFLGTTLAAISIMGTKEQTANVFMIMALPIFLLALPIFDTSLVTFSRIFKGRKISQGGQDHSSHRLVALGLSERKAVLFLYSISLLIGGIALTCIFFDISVYIAGIIAILLATMITLFGIFLGHVNIYERKTEEELKSEKRRHLVIDTLILYKRRIAEVLLDFFLIYAAYVSAFLLRYGGEIDKYNKEILLKSLPVIIGIKFVFFFYFGFYRGVWKYIGMHDLIGIFKGVLSSSIATICVFSIFYRLENYSRAVFIIDAVFCLMFVAGSRITLRALREYFLGFSSSQGKKLLLIGAGDAGDLLVREIRNNEAMNYQPVGFIDDDEQKSGRKLHGLPIFGNREDIPEIVSSKGIEEIILAIPSAPKSELKKISAICAGTGVPYRVIKHIHAAFGFDSEV